VIINFGHFKQMKKCSRNIIFYHSSFRDGRDLDLQVSDFVFLRHFYSLNILFLFILKLFNNLKWTKRFGLKEMLEYRLTETAAWL